MTAELIEKFLTKNDGLEQSVNIHFKDRHTVTGLFVHTVDYDELRSKNFWRIINNINLVQWNKTKDINLTRLYNGASFTRLSQEEF